MSQSIVPISLTLWFEIMIFEVYVAVAPRVGKRKTCVQKIWYALGWRGALDVPSRIRHSNVNNLRSKNTVNKKQRMYWITKYSKAGGHHLLWVSNGL